jgi:cytochrome c biogenesis protein
MNNKEISNDPLNRIWKFFASVKLTIVLLLTLAATSIIGTLIPQNESPARYVQAFGEPLYRLFDILDLFDMYHSWWFQLLVLLLTLNVVICSLDRLSATWKIVFVKNPRFNLTRFRGLKNKVQLNHPQAADTVIHLVEPILARSFGYRRQEDTDHGFVFFAEKWRWTRLGVYVVHTSVVLLLIGSLIGSLFGFEGYVNIAEGEAVGTIQLRNTNKPFPLGFEIRCDDFNVSFYRSGMPKEFRSSLTIIEQGQPVIKKDIIVNDPLRYRGINMFQSSYGELPPAVRNEAAPDEIALVFVSKDTGKQYSQKARIGQEIQLPEELGRLVLKEFRTKFNFRGRDLGAALVGMLTQKNDVSVEVILPVRFPSFDRMNPMFNPQRNDAVFISVSDFQSSAESVGKRYYTGLQVTKDPGVWVVYSGFILMLMGCMITFFMSHQRICIEVIQSGKKSRIMVSATANKNKLGMQRKVQRIADKLAASGKDA